MASIVASARRSGHIVLYLPDGDRLRKNGYFVTPNALREGMFDLQNLSQDVCAQLLASHEDDLKGMEADKETMERYFKDTQLKRITDYSGDSMSLVDLLKYAQERKIHAPVCYSVVVDRLMNQEEKPFLMVMDEFNCFYDDGHYFHMTHDEDVRDPIPYEKINLFEHALGAMALSTDDDDVQSPKLIKRGGIIVGVSESHAVPRKITDGLTAAAERQSMKEGQPSNMHVVEVPRFSEVEVDHILANFEATGVGKLRLDRGDTIMDEQEVAYLKMVSGCIGQQLLDASVL
jgi:small subunit ribosomal protein S29